MSFVSEQRAWMELQGLFFIQSIHIESEQNVPESDNVENLKGYLQI